MKLTTTLSYLVKYANWPNISPTMKTKQKSGSYPLILSPPPQKKVPSSLWQFIKNSWPQLKKPKAESMTMCVCEREREGKSPTWNRGDFESEFCTNLSFYLFNLSFFLYNSNSNPIELGTFYQCHPQQKKHMREALWCEPQSTRIKTQQTILEWCKP